MEDLYKYFQQKLKNAQENIEIIQRAASASAELRPTLEFVELDNKAQEVIERIARMQELLNTIYAKS